MKSKRKVARKVAAAPKKRTPAPKKTEIPEPFSLRRVTLDVSATAYDAKAVKQTRQLLGISQPAFAQFLGVSIMALRSWEQGRHAPNNIASRFLDEIRANPEFWKQRVEESLRVKERRPRGAQ